MSVARRSLALWLAAGAALLLLLLARLPPSPSPAPSPGAARPPRHRALAPAPSLTADTASLSTQHETLNETSSPRSAAPPAPPSSSVKTATNNNNNSSSSGSSNDNKNNKKRSDDKKPKVVLTKDLYAGGHVWPHPERCGALGAGVTALILVTSAPAHRAARDAVRLTWGHYAARADVAIAFVLGLPPHNLMPQLEAEDALFGDLVMGRFVDSYSNLTLKTLSMLEWADTYCPRARTLLKTDDDMFINVPRLLQFILHPSRVNVTDVIWGRVLKKALPKRTPKSKYYLSPVQFPGRVLPDFATGPAYLLPRAAVRPLLRAAPPAPYLRLEDVFLTGLLAARLGLRRHHAHEFYNKKISAHPCAVQRGVSIHMVRYHEQFDLWRKLLDGTARCS